MKYVQFSFNFSKASLWVTLFSWPRFKILAKALLLLKPHQKSVLVNNDFFF